MGKKITDAEFEVVAGRDGRRPDAQVYIRKELPGWFKPMMLGLAALVLLLFALDKAFEKSGQPSPFDPATAQPEAAER